MKKVIVEYETYKFKELSEEAKQKAIETLSDINVNYDDWWWCDRLICDKDWEIFEGKNKVYFDLDRYSGWFIQFPDLKIKNAEKFFTLVGIPKRLLKLVDLEFKQEHYGGGRGKTVLVWDWTGRHEITPKYAKILDNAVEKWEQITKSALSKIRQNYEYLTSEKAIIETIEANDYSFTADGKIF